MKRFAAIVISATLLLAFCSCSVKYENPKTTLLTGFAMADITPPNAVDLAGADYPRASQGVESGLFVTALAISNADNTEQHVIASLDLIETDCAGFINEVREYLSQNKERAQGLCAENTVLFATHTHCGPRLAEWKTPSGYVMGQAPENGMGATEYRKYITPIVGEAIISAWNSRERSYISVVKGNSGLGWNRISVYEDGTQKMYGSPADIGYVGPLSGKDQSLNLIYIFNQKREVKGVIMGVGFPFQTCESEMTISSDIMATVRNKINGEFYVLPLISAAGDQSPYDIECGRSWQDMYSSSRYVMRTVYGRTLAKEILKYIDNQKAADSVETQTLLKTGKTTANTSYPVELHAIRLGSTAIISNPLELYIDWGNEIKQNSPADLTLIGQLSSNTSTQQHGLGYGPTKAAMDGAGYGGNNNILSLNDIELLVKSSISLIGGLYG